MSYGTFEQTPSAIFRQVVDTNLMGQVHGARAAMRQFRRQGSGSLVMVGSLFSRVGSPYVSPYVTSKFGLLGLAEVLRQELRASRGIRATIVLPAAIDTPIYQKAANYTGRHVHPLPPITGPTRVAKAIVRSAGRRRSVVFVGRTQRLVVILHDLAPGIFDRVSTIAQNLIALRRRGAPRSAGTVFAPGDDDGGVSGGWRSVPLRVLGSGAVVGAVALYLRRLLT
jgi:short-subunit dehydrogenase